MGSSFQTVHDVSSQINTLAVGNATGVAAGAGDNVEVTSPAIDRIPLGQAGYISAVLALAYLTTVQAAQTLKVTVKIADSDDGTSFSADTTLVNAQTVETGLVTAKNNTFEVGADLAKYKRYVRFKITMDLSAGATDTFNWGALLILGGADRMPV